MMNEIVDCIAAATEADGFLEPIPKSEFGTREYPNYVHVWLNNGLVGCGVGGQPPGAVAAARHAVLVQPLRLSAPIAKDLMLGYQGMIANTTVYLSEAGLPDDLATTIENLPGELVAGPIYPRRHGRGGVQAPNPPRHRVGSHHRLYGPLPG